MIIFKEIEESAQFKQDYSSFVRNLKPHIQDDLRDSFRWMVGKNPTKYAYHLGEDIYLWKKPPTINCPLCYLIYQWRNNKVTFLRLVDALVV